MLCQWMRSCACLASKYGREAERRSFHANKDYGANRAPSQTKPSLASGNGSFVFTGLLKNT